MDILQSPLFVLGLMTLIVGAVSFLALKQSGWLRARKQVRFRKIKPEQEESMLAPTAFYEAAPFYTEIEQEMMPQLELRLLRVAQNEQAITFLFVNEGRSVINLGIRATAGMTASIEPVDLLGQKETGYISLQPPPPAGTDRVDIDIRYEDWKGRPCLAEYQYIVAAETWVSERDYVCPV